MSVWGCGSTFRRKEEGGKKKDGRRRMKATEMRWGSSFLKSMEKDVCLAGGEGRNLMLYTQSLVGRRRVSVQFFQQFAQRSIGNFMPAGKACFFKIYPVAVFYFVHLFDAVGRQERIVGAVKQV